MQITLAYSPAPREVHELSLDLAPGRSAAQAVEVAMALGLTGGSSSALPHLLGSLDFSQVTWSVWGRSIDPQQVLNEGDRLALCRALKVDPKTARRERFAKQGSRATGLFAKKKRGVEAGY
jgi:putative ubiquitin-RnfH superfamily antitoxin RatB of RatAB toxin-antitoxin module